MNFSVREHELEEAILKFWLRSFLKKKNRSELFREETVYFASYEFSRTLFKNY